MPEAMMKHIRNLEQDVRTLEASDGKDHAALASKIEGHTKLLISSCTMDGKAHDALHDWLMPFLRLNKEYAAAPDADTKLTKFQEIQDSLATFHEQFE
jgi:flavorubredoxin